MLAKRDLNLLCILKLWLQLGGKVTTKVFTVGRMQANQAKMLSYFDIYFSFLLLFIMHSAVAEQVAADNTCRKLVACDSTLIAVQGQRYCWDKFTVYSSIIHVIFLVIELTWENVTCQMFRVALHADIVPVDGCEREKECKIG